MERSGAPVPAVGDSIDVQFDETIYSLDVIQRASLKYTDLASIAIGHAADGSLCAKVAPFDDAGISAAELGKVLVNEVLDQALRERIANETAAERNLILSYTFSRSKLVKN